MFKMKLPWIDRAITAIALIAAVWALVVAKDTLDIVIEQRDIAALIGAWNIVATSPQARGNVGQKEAVEFLFGRGEDLRSINLRQAHLVDVKLPGADLTNAGLEGAILERAQLAGAVLLGARLRQADLRRADLTAADLQCVLLTRPRGGRQRRILRDRRRPDRRQPVGCQARRRRPDRCHLHRHRHQRCELPGLPV